MREILRAATLGSAQLDDCFEKLSKEGRLDGPFGRYVEELEQQQKAKPGDGLLDRVLVIVRDRVKAEGGASKELRVLARALRCSDEDETREFLSKEFSISLDFAARFEQYVEAAAAFADSSEDGGGASPGSFPGQPDSLAELSTPLGELSTPDSLRAESIWLSTAAETQAATKVLSHP